jgi:hypothetical protein
MRGSHHLGAPTGARRRLVAAVVGAAVALPVVVPAAAQAARGGGRQVTAPVAVARTPAPAAKPVTVASGASHSAHVVYGHKLA